MSTTAPKAVVTTRRSMPSNRPGTSASSHTLSGPTGDSTAASERAPRVPVSHESFDATKQPSVGAASLQNQVRKALEPSTVHPVAPPKSPVGAISRALNRLTDRNTAVTTSRDARTVSAAAAPSVPLPSSLLSSPGDNRSRSLAAATGDLSKGTRPLHDTASSDGRTNYTLGHKVTVDSTANASTTSNSESSASFYARKRSSTTLDKKASGDSPATADMREHATSFSSVRSASDDSAGVSGPYRPQTRPTSYSKALRVLGLDAPAAVEQDVEAQDLEEMSKMGTEFLSSGNIAADVSIALHALANRAGSESVMGDDDPYDTPSYRVSAAADMAENEENFDGQMPASGDVSTLSEGDIALLRRQNVFLDAGNVRVGVAVIGANLRTEERSGEERGGAPTAEYMIRVRVGMRAWLVNRTYADFKQLHAHLLAGVPPEAKALLPKLPGKISDVSRLALFQSTDRINGRMKEFQTYLRMAARVPECWEGEAGLHLIAFLDDAKRTLHLQASFARIMKRTQVMVRQSSDIASLHQKLVEEEEKKRALDSRLASVASLLRDQLEASGFGDEAPVESEPAPPIVVSDAPAPTPEPSSQRNKLRDALKKQKLATKPAEATSPDPRAVIEPGSPLGIPAHVHRQRMEFIALLKAARQHIGNRNARPVDGFDIAVAGSRSRSSSTGTRLTPPKNVLAAEPKLLATARALKSSISASFYRRSVMHDTIDENMAAEHSGPSASASFDLGADFTAEDIDDIVNVILSASGISGMSGVGAGSMTDGKKSFSRSMLDALFDHASFAASISSAKTSFSTRRSGLERTRSIKVNKPTSKEGLAPPLSASNSPRVRRRAASESAAGRLAKTVASILEDVRRDVAPAGRGDTQAMLDRAVAAGETALERLMNDGVLHWNDANATQLIYHSRCSDSAVVKAARKVLLRSCDALVESVAPSVEADIRRNEAGQYVVSVLRNVCGFEAVPVGFFATKTYLPDSPVEILVPLPPLLVVGGTEAHPTPSAASGCAYDAPDVTNASIWYAKANEALCAIATTPLLEEGTGSSGSPVSSPQAKPSDHRASYSDDALCRTFMVLLPPSAHAQVQKVFGVLTGPTPRQHVNSSVIETALALLKSIATSDDSETLDKYQEELMKACSLCGVNVRNSKPERLTPPVTAAVAEAREGGSVTTFPSSTLAPVAEDSDAVPAEVDANEGGGAAAAEVGLADGSAPSVRRKGSYQSATSNSTGSGTVLSSRSHRARERVRARYSRGKLDLASFSSPEDEEDASNELKGEAGAEAETPLGTLETVASSSSPSNDADVVADVNFQLLWECLCLASVAKVLLDAASDVRHPSVHHLAALSHGVRAGSDSAKRTAASKIDLSVIPTLESSPYEMKAMQCIGGVAQPTKAAAWLRGLDGHKITIRNTAFHVNQLPNSNNNDSVPARFFRRAFVTCLVDNIRITVTAGDQMAYKSPLNPVVLPSGVPANRDITKLPSEYHSASLAPLHAALFSDIATCIDVSLTVSKAAKELASAMKQPRELQWKLHVQPPCMNAFEAVYQCSTPSASATNSADTATSLTSAFLRCSNIQGDEDALPVFDSKRLSLPTVAQAQVLNTSTSRSIPIPVELEKLPELLRKSVVVIQAWLQYEAPVLLHRTVQEVHEQGSVTSNAASGLSSVRHVKVVTPSTCVLDTTTTTAFGGPTRPTTASSLKPIPSKSCAESLREVFRQGSSSSNLGHHLYNDMRTHTNTTAADASANLGAAMGGDTSGMVNASAVSVMTIALFVEAAKNALKPLAEKPRWQSFLPKSGFFEHPMEVLAAFVGVYSTIDLKAVAITPLGIVSGSDWSGLQTARLECINQAAAQLRDCHAFLALCLPQCMRENGKASAKDDQDGKESVADSIADLPTDAGEHAVRSRRFVPAFRMSHGTAADGTNPDAPAFENDPENPHAGLLGSMAPAGSTILLESIQAPGDKQFGLHFMVQLISTLLAAYGPLASRAAGSGSADVNAPLQEEMGTFPLFVSDLCLPWVNACSRVSVDQVAWLRCACAAARHQFSGVFKTAFGPGATGDAARTASSFSVHAFPSCTSVYVKGFRPDLLVHPLQSRVHALFTANTEMPSDLWHMFRMCDSYVIPEFWAHKNVPATLLSGLKPAPEPPASAKNWRPFLSATMFSAMSTAYNYVDGFSCLNLARVPAFAAVLAKHIGAKGVVPIGVLGQIIKYSDAGHLSFFHSAPMTKADLHKVTLGSFGFTPGNGFLVDHKLAAVGDMLSAVSRALFGSAKSSIQCLPGIFQLGVESHNNPCVTLQGHASRHLFMRIPHSLIASSMSFVRAFQPVEETLHMNSLAAYTDLARAALTRFDGVPPDGMDIPLVKKSSSASRHSTTTLHPIQESASRNGPLTVPSLISSAVENFRDQLHAVDLPAGVDTMELTAMERLWLSMFKEGQSLLVPISIALSPELKAMTALLPFHALRLLLSAAASAFQNIASPTVPKKSSRGSRKGSGASHASSHISGPVRVNSFAHRDSVGSRQQGPPQWQTQQQPHSARQQQQQQGGYEQQYHPGYEQYQPHPAQPAPISVPHVEQPWHQSESGLPTSLSIPFSPGASPMGSPTSIVDIKSPPGYSLVGYTPLASGQIAAVTMAADGSTLLIPLIATQLPPGAVSPVPAVPASTPSSGSTASTPAAGGGIRITHHTSVPPQASPPVPTSPPGFTAGPTASPHQPPMHPSARPPYPDAYAPPHVPVQSPGHGDYYPQAYYPQSHGPGYYGPPHGQYYPQDASPAHYGGRGGHGGRGRGGGGGPRPPREYREHYGPRR